GFTNQSQHSTTSNTRSPVMSIQFILNRPQDTSSPPVSRRQRKRHHNHSRPPPHETQSWYTASYELNPPLEDPVEQTVEKKKEKKEEHLFKACYCFRHDAPKRVHLATWWRHNKSIQGGWQNRARYFKKKQLQKCPMWQGRDPTVRWSKPGNSESSSSQVGSSSAGSDNGSEINTKHRALEQWPREMEIDGEESGLSRGMMRVDLNVD
ncbi:hypothetical protein EX30DRAFT_343485, partial [Ascodesmis nigricans]